VTDLLLQLTPEGGDLVLENGDLVLDEGLGTAALISVLSDGRARADDDLPGGPGDDPRGWWGADLGDDYGSRFWLLARAKVSDETVNKARELVEAGLRWLLVQGIAERIEVDAFRVGTERIDVTVEITRGAAPRWASLWEGTAETRFAAGFVRVTIGVS
jgi:phage gp46-like protein